MRCIVDIHGNLLGPNQIKLVLNRLVIPFLETRAHLDATVGHKVAARHALLLKHYFQTLKKKLFDPILKDDCIF